MRCASFDLMCSIDLTRSTADKSQCGRLATASAGASTNIGTKKGDIDVGNFICNRFILRNFSNQMHLTKNPCSIALMLYHPAMPKWFEPRAVTKPIPLSLAFEIARSMQNLPTTGPKKR